MKNIPAKVFLPAGIFTLSPGEDGTLLWQGSGPEALPQPETARVLAWDGCVDNRGGFHLVIHSSSRHLIYCHSADGRRWNRQSLSRLDRDDVRLQDLCILAAPQPQIIYLITGASPDPVAVSYAQSPQGNWQGRRLELPQAGRLEALLPPTETARGAMLGACYLRQGRSRLFQIPPLGGEARELFSAPSPMEQVQLLSDSEGRLHLAYISQGQVLADHYPLCEEAKPVDSLCLYRRGEKILCSFMLEQRWVNYELTPDGWQARPEPAPGKPVLEISVRGRQLTPPSAQAENTPVASPSRSYEEKPAGGDPPPAALTQTLHNQAVLLSQLQQSFRDMQQQFFAMDARIKALSAQAKALQSLKDRCTQLENALAALEELACGPPPPAN